jgi:hypothetical protein
MPQSIANTCSPSQVLSGPTIPEAYGGMIFGWRPPASCYGSGTQTPQQVDAVKPCSMGGSFLGLLAGAALIGLAMRKK